MQGFYWNVFVFFPPSRGQWESVEYFNNKIICDLVEEKFKGIIAILVSLVRPSFLVLTLISACLSVQCNADDVNQDEECLRPGDATDITFLEKLEDSLGGHAHFMTYVSYAYTYTLTTDTSQSFWRSFKRLRCLISQMCRLSDINWPMGRVARL